MIISLRIHKTIVNCFRKAGISAENQDAAIAEADDHFKDLQDGIDALRTVQPDLIPEDINAASLVDVDAEVSDVQPPPTDAEILADFLETDNISDDELVDDSDGVDDVPMECPGKMSSHVHWSFSKISLCLQMIILLSPIALS